MNRCTTRRGFGRPEEGVDFPSAADPPVSDGAAVKEDQSPRPGDCEVAAGCREAVIRVCSTPERAALRSLLDLGYEDTFRLFEQQADSFSWWDYRTAGFRLNAGLRIDLILANKSLSRRCLSSTIDNGPRGHKRPSDHAPIMAEFR